MTVGCRAMYCDVSTEVLRDTDIPQLTPSLAAQTATATTRTGGWHRRRRPRPGSGSDAVRGGPSMLSRASQYHVMPGSLLTLACEFYMESFHAFHNPVIWLKSQTTAAQPIKINVMRIIQSPFADEGDRFDVSLVKQPPRYELLLTVKGRTLSSVLGIARTRDASTHKLHRLAI